MNKMLLKILVICLAFNYATGTLVLKGNETQINLDNRATPLECKLDATFFSTNNITYGYGIFADCTVFIFDATNETVWKRIEEKLKTRLSENDYCYGNDFIVDLQFNGDGTPIIFVMDKTHLIYRRIQLTSTLKDVDFFYSLDAQLNEKGIKHGWTRRGGEQYYKKDLYGHAGTVTGNVISLIRQTVTNFQVIFGIRKHNLDLEYRCMLSTTSSNGPPPIYIDYLPSSDWRATVLDKWNPRDGAPKTNDWYIEQISYLWIICVCLTIFAVLVAILTGYIINRSRKAQIKLEVAVEALLASSCTNPEHQLRRSALLNKCGFPSVELNDTTITTAGPLQDDTNGMQTVNEFDVLAEQIRRVQAAPEKSDKSGTNSTQSSKR